tara:strand:+ start:1479 stop:1634 length:156 start_codon:yes stop_codon:yes gene_type:complete
MNERMETVNTLLSVFCKDHLEEEYLSDRWYNNLILVKMYANELMELVGERK